MNTTESLSRENLLTDCERSMRYHQARERFFNAMHLCIQFLIFASASVGVSKLLDAFLPVQERTILLAVLAVMALLALFSLVYNPATKSNLHRSLYKDFTKLYADLMATPDADEATRTDWIRQIHLLYADEPPTYRALLAHCDNQIAICLNQVSNGYWVDLRWYHRLFRNFYPFQGAEFPNRNQVHQK